ncbi:MAG: amino acid--tRNA ligase-related protein, partial [Woeseiaceae bacterium]
AAAFEAATGIDPLRADIDALADAAGADDRLRGALGARRHDWLDLLMSEKVARSFESGRLTIIAHYPAGQAALARVCPDDPALADRFEIFLGDMELANGYVELGDAAEQRRRWLADQAARAGRGLPERPLDEALLAALEAGLPACAGVAVGFDRLLMINERCDDIRRVQTFEYRSMK